MALYATHGGSGATDTNLYTVNPSDVSVTLVGDTGHFFTGLAFDPTDPTKLYGVTGNVGSDQRTLFLMDATDGSVILIGALGTTVADITFDASGQMYGFKPSTKALVTINKTSGAVVEVGASGLPLGNGGGIAIDPDDDNLVWIFADGGAGDMWTMNKSTGAATDIGVLVPGVSGSNITAVSFEPNGVLWGVGSTTPSPLFTIGLVPNAFDEFTTNIVGYFSSDETVDGLAWSPAVSPPDLATVPGKYAVYHNGQWHILS